MPPRQIPAAKTFAPIIYPGISVLSLARIFGWCLKSSVVAIPDPTAAHVETTKHPAVPSKANSVCFIESDFSEFNVDRLCCSPVSISPFIGKVLKVLQKITMNNKHREKCFIVIMSFLLSKKNLIYKF